MMEYELKTYDDFMALTDEQFDHMVIDFKAWRACHKSMMAHLEIASKAAGKPINELAELPKFFTWIDDGKHEGTVNVSIVSPDMGGEEVSVAQFKFNTQS